MFIFRFQGCITLECLFFSSTVLLPRPVDIRCFSAKKVPNSFDAKHVSWAFKRSSSSSWICWKTPKFNIRYPKMAIFKRKYMFQTIILGIHVSFRGCKFKVICYKLIRPRRLKGIFWMETRTFQRMSLRWIHTCRTRRILEEKWRYAVICCRGLLYEIEWF